MELSHLDVPKKGHFFAKQAYLTVTCFTYLLFLKCLGPENILPVIC